MPACLSALVIVAGVGSSGIRRRESFAGPSLVLLAPALTDVSFPMMEIMNNLLISEKGEVSIFSWGCTLHDHTSSITVVWPLMAFYRL